MQFTNFIGTVKLVFPFVAFVLIFHVRGFSQTLVTFNWLFLSM